MRSANSVSLKGNLHGKPICAHLWRGVVSLSTMLQVNSSPTAWHGKWVQALSRSVLFAGYLGITPIALIEAAARGAIGISALGIHIFFEENSSYFFQKHSLKAISGAFHSLLLSLSFAFLLFKHPKLNCYTVGALIDHAIHLGSAAWIQYNVGAYLDQKRGKDPELATLRTLYLLKDSHPNLLQDIGKQIQKDFNIDIHQRMRDFPRFEEYLARYPQSREFLLQFNLRRFLNDSDYRVNLIGLIRNFLIDIQLIGPGDAEDNPYSFELNKNTKEERGYQEHLANLLKDSLIEIYRNPSLYSCLSEENYRGDELLKMNDANTYIPLTAYTQYRELKQPIQCPSSFSGNLSQYNERKEKLEEAKAALLHLSNQQERELVQKILRGADLKTSAEIQNLYSQINRLAAPLYQGPLMNKVYINVANRGGDHEDLTTTKNLFQTAWEEAIREM